jgi:hypothetical protein
MDERMRFVIRLKDGESMASLCREFGISRKTGYKIFERYENSGLEGLTDRTLRPFRYANQLPAQVEAAIVAARKEVFCSTIARSLVMHRDVCELSDCHADHFDRYCSTTPLFSSPARSIQ